MSKLNFTKTFFITLILVTLLSITSTVYKYIFLGDYDTYVEPLDEIEP